MQLLAAFSAAWALIESIVFEPIALSAFRTGYEETAFINADRAHVEIKSSFKLSEFLVRLIF